jgi:dTDP-4-dehydrorhamnose 3,5-epimerase
LNCSHLTNSTSFIIFFINTVFLTIYLWLYFMKFHDTKFKGLYIVDFVRFEDERGVLVKPWVADELEKIFGYNMETYMTSSKAGTMRGLHYQKGSEAQNKFVTCLSGKIEDVAVDLRHNSTTYGEVFNITLNKMDGCGVIIPEGFAHGIYAYEDSLYAAFSSKDYAPHDEGGVLWSSIPILRDFPVTFVSKKDAQLPALKEIL